MYLATHSTSHQATPPTETFHQPAIQSINFRVMQQSRYTQSAYSATRHSYLSAKQLYRPHSYGMTLAGQEYPTRHSHTTSTPERPISRPHSYGTILTGQVYPIRRSTIINTRTTPTKTPNKHTHTCPPLPCNLTFLPLPHAAHSNSLTPATLPLLFPCYILLIQAYPSLSHYPFLPLPNDTRSHFLIPATLPLPFHAVFCSFKPSHPWHTTPSAPCHILPLISTFLHLLH